MALQFLKFFSRFLMIFSFEWPVHKPRYQYFKMIHIIGMVALGADV